MEGADLFPGLQKLVQVEGAEKTDPLPLPFALQKVLELSPFSMCAADIRHPAQPLVYVNDRFLDETKYLRSEILGFNCKFLQGEGTNHDTVKSMAIAIQERRDFLGRLLNFTKTGEKLWNYLLMQPLFNKEGECTHFTALQIFVKIDNPKMIAETAREMALVAEYVEKQGTDAGFVGVKSQGTDDGNPFQRSSIEDIPSLIKPSAPSRQSLEHGQERRSSILASETRLHLDKLLVSYDLMMVLINTSVHQGNHMPILYASPPLLDATWISEDEILGSNLTLLIGSAQTSAAQGTYEKMVDDVRGTKDYHEDRWLRTRHKMIDMLWCHMCIKPLKVQGSLSTYAVATFFHIKDRMFPLLVAEPEPHCIEALQGWAQDFIHSNAKEGRRDSGHIRPCLDEERTYHNLSSYTGEVSKSSLYNCESFKHAAASVAGSSLFSTSPAAPAPPAALASSNSLFGASPDANPGKQPKTVLNPETRLETDERTSDHSDVQASEDSDVQQVDLSDSDEEGGTEAAKEEPPQPMIPQRMAQRMSVMRRRREAEVFTLLPVKTNWIDLVVETMSKPDAPRWGLSEGQIQAMKVNLGKYGKDLIEED